MPVSTEPTAVGIVETVPGKRYLATADDGAISIQHAGEGSPFLPGPSVADGARTEFVAFRHRILVSIPDSGTEWHIVQISE